jgi:hypothetical protein
MSKQYAEEQKTEALKELEAYEKGLSKPREGEKVNV